MRSILRSIGFTGLGLVIGAGLGLYLGWVAWPTEFTDANPGVLQEDYRRDYLLMVAIAYTLDNDLPAAQQRIASLGTDGDAFLVNTIIDLILQQGDEATIRQLVHLAADLGLSSPAMQPYLTP
jgi:hypothetical protein